MAPNSSYPGGQLFLAADGRIIDGPTFFTGDLALGSDESIFHAFDPGRDNHLHLSRVVGMPDGGLEYHARLNRAGREPRFVRYWDVGEVHDGPAVAAFHVVDDSSVRRSHEWALRRARREFLVGATEYVADALVRPLAGLRSLTEVLRDRPQDAPEAAERILAVLDDLDQVVTGVAKLGTSADPSTNLPILMDDLGAIVASWSDKGVKVEVSGTSAEGAAISTHAVERILSPIVMNAIEARPQSGVVHFEYVADACDVTVTISDDGRGMTLHEKTRAEDPFYTTKRGHAGLGLSGAREALRKLGGEWEFTSSRNKGTRVRVTLPLV